MTYLERMHNSLSSKMFHTILMFSAVLSLAAVSFGFYLYNGAVQDQYSSIAFNISKTASIMLESEDELVLADAVLKRYDSLSAEEKELKDNDPDAYYELFADFETTSQQRMRRILHMVANENNATCIYYAAYDIESRRLIYLIDSDMTDSYAHPGYWVPVTNIMYERLTTPLIDAETGETVIPSFYRKTENYGYQCTSWDVVSADGKYILLVMTDIDMNLITRRGRLFLIQYLLFLLAVTLILDYIIVQRLKKTVVKPITDINQAARSYMKDKEDGSLGEHHFSNLKIHTGDEIESLAVIFGAMEQDISEYIRNLTAVTAERERIGAELNIASQIQSGMLPNIFPPFPERREFDVIASMKTAKEVGGDFYDFFLIDDDHLALVIADVSGKGIPAALFMMACKIIISNVSSLGVNDPGKILEKVNEHIMKNNPAEMFVTVWLGILEIKTGKLTAANGGHEYPCLMRAGGQFELLKDKHGLVLGAMEESRYTSYENQMNPGDRIFVYTDGVTEASNENNELFGTDRLLEALNSDPAAQGNGLMENVSGAISAFTGTAPQFDDITMLAMQYNGGNEDERTDN